MCKQFFNNPKESVRDMSGSGYFQKERRIANTEVGSQTSDAKRPDL